ncbi:uncharacterized protein LOC141802156 [Halichoeres trimaculatus]|uniref:uncharacterized protein LOC141802156 n=1 Tax=Halichoeres trimaculatus TaxID=147232 RepID=UPI003D9E7496
MVRLEVVGVFLYVVLVPQTAVLMSQIPSFIIREGGEISLSCENVRNDPTNCDRTTWSFSQLTKTSAVDVVSGGQIRNRRNNKSDRLSLTENCSLVIKNITYQDAGRYFCIQEESGWREGAVVDLSVVTLTEVKKDGHVTLKCRLSTRLTCEHSVSWLLSDQDEDDEDIHMLKTICVAMLSFQTSHPIYTSRRYESLQCDMKEKSSNRSLKFTFNPQFSGHTAPGNINTTTARPGGLWWLYIIVAVGLAALCLMSLFFLRRTKNKGNKPQTDKHSDDPEDGICYVSISHNKKTKSKVHIRGGGNAVTYSTVKPSNIAADPNNLYATII